MGGCIGGASLNCINFVVPMNIATTKLIQWKTTEMRGNKDAEWYSLVIRAGISFPSLSVFDYQVIKSNQTKSAETLDFTAFVLLCKRVRFPSAARCKVAEALILQGFRYFHVSKNL